MQPLKKVFFNGGHIFSYHVVNFKFLDLWVKNCDCLASFHNGPRKTSVPCLNNCVTSDIVLCENILNDLVLSP